MQVMLALAGHLRSRPDGSLPLLDPVEDMDIKDAELERAVRDLQHMEEQLKSNAGAGWDAALVDLACMCIHPGRELLSRLLLAW